jgi:hypothetical protein
LALLGAIYLFFVGIVVAGLYFVFDPTTPKPYKLLIIFGLLGIALFFFMGSSGGKGGSLGGQAPPERDVP